MKIKFTLKVLVMVALMACFTINAKAQAIAEGFDNITLLTGSGWFMQNNSVPVGSTNWFQGNAATFPAFSGATNSYIGANFNNTTGTNTISNWLLTPNRTFKNGDVITFRTRKATPDTYPDRLQVRMSTNGTSTNVGAGSAAVGDFTTLMLSINPTLVTGVYPIAWTQFTITVSGLSAPTSGRVAFRYFVTSGGPTGANSDYIGIDDFVYTPYVCPTLTVAPTSITGGTAGVSYSQSLSQTGALGTPTYAVTAGALPAGLTLSTSGILSGTPTVVGTFNFTVTVADASGCMGSQAYTLVIACPTFVFSPGSFPNGTAGTAYSQAVSTTGGVGTVNYAVTSGSLPTGLSLSAGGAITGTPTVTGTFNFMITATDANACTAATTYSITIVCPTGGATLTVSPAAVCSNAGIITIGGGSPAGGVYSGTGVSGTTFDPSAGSQTITYTLVDTYGCTQVAANTITVNTAPTVTASSNAVANTICSGGSVILTGGGADTYVWDNSVTDGLAFAPTGTTTYMVTGTTTATGCSEMAMITVTVNTSPTMVASSDAPGNTICEGNSVTLMGGVADTYTWDNGVIDAVAFTPTATTTYMVTGTMTATGCSATATITITVNSLPAVTASSDAIANTICEGGAVTLTGAGADTYVWDNSVTDGLAFAPTATTTYMVTGTETATGCSAMSMITITVNTLPVVDITLSMPIICESAGVVILDGESPTGGVFSGTSVTGNTFDASIGIGIYPITYTYTDVNGCINSDSDNLQVDLCTGIANALTNTDLNVFPNPSNGLFTIVYNQTISGNLVIKITDVQGKVIANESMTNFTGAYKNTFDLSSLGNGVYLLEVTGSQNQVHRKIILQ